MAIKLTITDDRAEYDATQRRLRSADRRAAESGLLDPEQAVKGWRHEVGRGVPERPWLGPSADQAARRLDRVAKRELGKLADGKTKRGLDALGPMGDLFTESARDFIERGRVGGPDLAESTLRAKSPERRKLIDSHDMIDALETKVGRDQGDG